MLGHSIARGCVTMPHSSPGTPRIPRAGLTAAAIESDLGTTGGDGLLYCFAVN